jgi:uncharacterized membrane protein YcaP (DUF421 family)
LSSFHVELAEIGTIRRRVCEDRRAMWQLALPPQELVLRSVLVYLAFLAALRLSGKRELGQFMIFDLCLVLLASNALQPAMTGPDATLAGGLIILVTLFTMNRLVAYARTHSVFLRRLLDYPPTTIARDGNWDDVAIEHEGLLEDDLSAALREHGLDDIKQVKLAVLEHDGAISVVPKQGGRVRMPPRRRRYRAQNAPGST